MRSTLEELFYGNICPNTDCRSRSKETKQLMAYIAEHHDSLLSTLTDAVSFFLLYRLFAEFFVISH